MRRIVGGLALLCSVMGCDDGDGADPLVDAGTMDATADAAPQPDPDMGASAVAPRQGVWLVTVNLVEFGEIKVDFQLEVATDAAGFSRLDLSPRAMGMTGEVVASVEDVPIDDEGRFAAAFDTFTVPGEFSPSGSPVELRITLEGTVTAEDAMCGLVTGEVVTFMQALTETTFGAVPVANGTPPPVSCGGEAVELPRIEDCPLLQPGRNEAFLSGGEMRRFHLVVPDGQSPDAPAPLLLLHHGVLSFDPPWGNVDFFLEATDVEARAAAAGFIAVVPASRDLALEWASSAEGDTPDLAFFDDLITCIDAQYGVDADRVYVAGHSAGGIYTTYLAIRRSEVLAAAMVMSGGLTIELGEAMPLPLIVGWGGVEDMAFGQDFDLTTNNLLEAFGEAGWFRVACNHGGLPIRDDIEGSSRHTWPVDGLDWALSFFTAHPRGVTPLPWVAGLPPGAVPEFCALVE